ncbi:hypothetical protein PCANC_22002 [Puccinia coronata f. sp. avenae]|uniref:Uncharacterized protein n=1 Tax=Puccinia coronata f. sp. avenae TaxID=200324 RepID=A0A2N5SF99_9BASI|nr:hypothetical protein PCANC_22002 [Puccinia coronata f. sp. avenae]
MPCCTSNHTLVRRAIPSPTPVAALPAGSAVPVSSSATPILLFPGENPSDLRGAPFTTLPASVLATLSPAAIAVATLAPTITSHPASQAVPTPALPTSSASLGTSRIPQPTASGSALPSPSSQIPDSNSQPQSSSTTTVAVVVSIIVAIVIGVIGYAVYRFHLRKKQGVKGESIKLRPLITANSISRPILSTPAKPALPINHPSFRRARESLGSRGKAPPPTLSPIQEKGGLATSKWQSRGDPRKTRDFYTYETTNILDSYGSETSYPSTYAAEVEFEYPIFRPSPAQIPRIHNVQDAYPTTPSEGDDIKVRSPPSSSSPSYNQSARRLQNIPFKIPKPLPSHSTKPLRRL